MEKLQKTVTIKATGTLIKTHCVEREGDVCWYRRDDGVHEVFKVQIVPPFIKFGASYPEREKYPGNEDFGATAWCYPEKAMHLAKKKYEYLLKKSEVE